MELGILSGNPDGTYKPEDKIARAAAAKVVTMMINIKVMALIPLKKICLNMRTSISQKLKMKFLTASLRISAATAAECWKG